MPEDGGASSIVPSTRPENGCLIFLAPVTTAASAAPAAKSAKRDASATATAAAVARRATGRDMVDLLEIESSVPE